MISNTISMKSGVNVVHGTYYPSSGSSSTTINTPFVPQMVIAMPRITSSYGYVRGNNTTVCFTRKRSESVAIGCSTYEISSGIRMQSINSAFQPGVTFYDDGISIGSTLNYSVEYTYDVWIFDTDIDEEV